jgi:hypothetical protein
MTVWARVLGTTLLLVHAAAGAWLGAGKTLAHLRIPGTGAEAIDDLLRRVAKKAVVSYSDIDDFADNVEQAVAHAGKHDSVGGVVGGSIHMDPEGISRIYRVAEDRLHFFALLADPVSRAKRSFCNMQFRSQPGLVASCGGNEPHPAALCDRASFEKKLVQFLSVPDGTYRHSYPPHTAIQLYPDPSLPPLEVQGPHGWSDWAEQTRAWCIAFGVGDCADAIRFVRKKLGVCFLPIRNQMVSVVSGIVPPSVWDVCGPIFGTPGAVDRAALEKAKERALEGNMFVGVSEYLNESAMSLLRRIRGPERDTCDYDEPVRRETYLDNPNGHPMCGEFKLSESTIAVIEELNSLDVDFYEYVKRRVLSDARKVQGRNSCQRAERDGAGPPPPPPTPRFCRVRQLIDEELIDQLIKDSEKIGWGVSLDQVDGIPAWQVDLQYCKQPEVQCGWNPHISNFTRSYTEKLYRRIEAQAEQCAPANKDGKRVRIYWSYIKRYSTEHRNSITIHVDESDVTGVLLLSDPAIVEGGDYFLLDRQSTVDLRVTRDRDEDWTFFEPRRKKLCEDVIADGTWDKFVVRDIPRGGGVIHRGHQGHAVGNVTGGVRYSFVFFADYVVEEEATN